MAYDSWTNCVKPKDYSGPFVGAPLVAGIFAAILAGIFDPSAVELTLILTAIGYCRWWLYGRLVCLGSDECLIGLALGVYSQHNQDIMGKLDTDYGVNILPAPSPMLRNDFATVVSTNTVQGFLLADQGSTTTPANPLQADIAAMYASFGNLGFTGEPESYEDLTGTVGEGGGQGVLSPQQASSLYLWPTPSEWQPNWHYPTDDMIVDAHGVLQQATGGGTSGSSTPDWPKRPVGGQLVHDGSVTWMSTGAPPGVGTMEVEFEGRGVYDAYIGLLLASIVAAAAAVVGAIPGVGWLLAVILGLIAAIFAALGGIIVGLFDNASPDRDDPSLGTIHPGKDVLFVLGRWIYDSAHTGWNELHPVLHCQKIGTVTDIEDPWTGQDEFSDEAKLIALRDDLCALAKDAKSPQTQQQQAESSNDWSVHPSVDGCSGDGKISEGELTHR